MYNVTAGYLTAMTTNARAHRLSGTANGTSFTGQNVIRNSFTIRNQFCPATAIELGGVYIGELDLTFTESFATAMNIRGSWKGVVITASIGVELSDNSFEYIPMGTFTVESAKWSDAGLQIVAYDNMAKFDETLNITSTVGAPYDYLNYICTTCGVTLGTTRADVEALPNGTEITSFSRLSTIETHRDLISAVAVFCSCFATINRSGELVLIPLPDTVSATAIIPASLRYSTSFSDFTSYYTSLKVEDDEGVVDYYDNMNIGGLTMDIGANPLLQDGLDTTIDRRCQTIIDGIANFHAVPFSATILPNPAYDLGDVISFTGGIGQGSVGCVMAITHKLDSTTIEGYGENPAASAAVTSLSKRVASNAKKNDSNSLQYYTFTNASELTIDSTLRKLFDIKFETSSDTTVEMWHEIKALNDLDGADTQSIHYYWYLDGTEELPFNEPVDTFGEDGVHTEAHPCWILTVSGGQVHSWEVWAECDNGTATIGVSDLHALLKGQKLVAEIAFDGDLPECEDIIDPRIVVGLPLANLSDTFDELLMQAPNPDFSLTETYSGITIGVPVASLSDTVTDFAIWVTRMSIVTEDGNNLIAENGDNFTTEGADN